MFAVRLGVCNAPPAAYFHTCPLAVTECMRSEFSIGNVGNTVATGIDNAPPYSVLRRGVEWKGLAANLTEVYGVCRASTSLKRMFDLDVRSVHGQSPG